MRAEANPERLLVADTATQRLLVREDEGREEIPSEASGAVSYTHLAEGRLIVPLLAGQKRRA